MVFVDTETEGMALARGPQTPPQVRSLLYWAHQYRKTWRGSIVTSFLFPLLYLSAMGVGLGSLVNKHAHTVDHVSYLHFVAPGLLAATAMQIGANDATYPVMASIKWIRTYWAMLATPLRVIDVLVGHLAWIACRLLLVSTIYLGVMAAFGAVTSPWALVALPAAVLTGISFSAPIAALAATIENDSSFAALNRFVLIPMFLFSGTFFPVGQLPGWLQVVAEFTPLYHGVALCRALALGQVSGWPLVGHAAYLAGLATVGVALARARFYRKLLV